MAKKTKKTSRKAKAKLTRVAQKSRGKSSKRSKMFFNVLFFALLIYGLYHAIIIDVFEGVSIIFGIVIIAVIVKIISRLMKKWKEIKKQQLNWVWLQ